MTLVTYRRDNFVQVSGEEYSLASRRLLLPVAGVTAVTASLCGASAFRRTANVLLMGD